VRLRELHRRMVADKMGRAVSRGLKLLESLYRQPVVSVSMIAETSDLSFQGAADLARQFVSLGILSETTGRKRHRLFAYRKYLALLGETKRPKKSAASTPGARTLAVRSVA